MHMHIANLCWEKRPREMNYSTFMEFLSCVKFVCEILWWSCYEDADKSEIKYLWNLNLGFEKVVT